MAVLCGMPTIYYSARSPTVWPQYTMVTDRQTGQTNRQRSDSIGQTILQTVAQKSADRQTWQDLYVVSHLGFPTKVLPRVLGSKTCNNSNNDSLKLSSPPLASSRNNSCSTFRLSFAFLPFSLPMMCIRLMVYCNSQPQLMSVYKQTNWQ